MPVMLRFEGAAAAIPFISVFLRALVLRLKGQPAHLMMEQLFKAKLF